VTAVKELARQLVLLVLAGAGKRRERCRFAMQGKKTHTEKTKTTIRFFEFQWFFHFGTKFSLRISASVSNR
jgi:hypothetical protein